MGAREAELAHAIDQNLTAADTISYCYAFPYLEIKLSTPDEQCVAAQTEALLTLLQKDPQISIVSHNRTPTPEQAYAYLKQQPNLKIKIFDQLSLGRIGADAWSTLSPQQLQPTAHRDQADLAVGVSYDTDQTIIWAEATVGQRTQRWSRVICTNTQKAQASSHDWIAMAQAQVWWLWLTLIRQT